MIYKNEDIPSTFDRIAEISDNYIIWVKETTLSSNNNYEAYIQFFNPSFQLIFTDDYRISKGTNYTLEYNYITNAYTSYLDSADINYSLNTISVDDDYITNESFARTDCIDILFGQILCVIVILWVYKQISRLWFRRWIMVKKILFTLILLLSFNSICFGAVDRTLLTKQLNTLKDNGVLYGIPNINVNEINTLLNNNNDYIFAKTTNSTTNPSDIRNKFFILCFTGNVTTNGFAWVAGNNWIRGNKYQLNGTNDGTGWFRMEEFQYSYIYTTANINTNNIHLNAGEELGGQYLSRFFDFEPKYDNIVSVQGYSGEIYQQYGLNYTAPNGSTFLGTLNDTLDNKYLRLRIINKNGVFECIYYLDGGYYGSIQANNNGFRINSANQVYFDPDYLSYNNVTSFTIFYSNNEDFSEATSIDFRYIFTPWNSTIQNGIITNYGSGDFTNQDLANVINNNVNNDDNVDSILASNTSGDYESFADKFGYTELDNPFTSTFLYFFQGICNALTTNVDTTLSADYKTFHFEISSADFITPSGLLKSFITILLVAGYIFGNIKFFNHIIHNIEIAKLDSLIALVGQDEFYEMDLLKF